MGLGKCWFLSSKVEYNQTTSVISDMNLDGDIGKKNK